MSSVKLNSRRSLCSSLLCSMVSYALDKSTYMAKVAAPLSLCLRILLIIVCSAITVLECGRNAYCVGDRMSCFSRWSMICLLMRVSKTLAMIDSSDMGL